MMTAEFMLSKRPVLRFTAALFFLLKLFSSHVYCIPKSNLVYTGGRPITPKRVTSARPISAV